jgi:hypothetical protein
MACLLLLVVIAALITGALVAPWPNNTVSFNIVASTLLLGGTITEWHMSKHHLCRRCNTDDA